MKTKSHPQKESPLSSASRSLLIIAGILALMGVAFTLGMEFAKPLSKTTDPAKHDRPLFGFGTAHQYFKK